VESGYSTTARAARKFPAGGNRHEENPHRGTKTKTRRNRAPQRQQKQRSRHRRRQKSQLHERHHRRQIRRRPRRRVCQPSQPYFPVDDRKAYVRLHQANLRKFRPDSEQEHQLLRHISSEQFEYERCRNSNRSRFRSSTTNCSPNGSTCPTNTSATTPYSAPTTTPKSIASSPGKRRSISPPGKNCSASSRQNRKDFPVNPPEPVDITADSGLINQPDPPPYVIEELLKIADQAKNEPTAVLPTFVIELIHDKELMRKYAPDYDYADLRERYPLPKPRLAA
jgi:hypothetical protein